MQAVQTAVCERLVCIYPHSCTAQNHSNVMSFLLRTLLLKVCLTFDEHKCIKTAKPLAEFSRIEGKTKKQLF